MGSGRREEVLAVSARLFQEKGYRSTSIEDLTSEMGFTKAALYYYVRSKQELLEELARQIGRELLAAAAKDFDGAGSASGALRAFARQHVAAVVANRAVLSVTLRERSELSPEVLGELEDMERLYVGRLTELVAKLPSRRRSRPAPSVATHLLLGMLASAVDWYRPDAGLPPEDVADVIVDLFLRGLATGRAAPRTVSKTALPTPSPSPSTGHDGRREQIVRVAASLFHAKGYEATTMQDIADELGLTKAALYYYVTGKQELLEELVRRVGYALIGAAEAVAEGRPPHRVLAAIIRLHLRWVHEQRALYSLYLLSRSSLSDAAFTELRVGERTYAELFRGVVRQGIKEGVFRPVDSRVVLPALLGGMNATLRWFHEGPLSVDDLGAVVADLVYHGYAPASP
ncbi:TetR/AcrR family transcriptional regulator [Pseudonocardia nigra]|uniref:TetR/AcrR family transcriptional regulator n=1 Tax=Pseudonocardia nigra TaxID=1921578 RepID=UPI001C5F6091|nr:TetR family transcriptional regulator [Pseudonocardia nigra]